MEYKMQDATSISKLGLASNVSQALYLLYELAHHRCIRSTEDIRHVIWVPQIDVFCVLRNLQCKWHSSFFHRSDDTFMHRLSSRSQ